MTKMTNNTNTYIVFLFIFNFILFCIVVVAQWVVAQWVVAQWVVAQCIPWHESNLQADRRGGKLSRIRDKPCQRFHREPPQNDAP